MTQNEIADNQEDFDTISLDQEDPMANYTVVPNALIRDESISPNCRWLIIYLISNKPGWKIKSRQLWNHTKGFIGRDAMLKIFAEGIESGYILREVITRKGLRGYKYTVSRTPKFKKCLRCPENQVPENQGPDFQVPENQGTYEVLSKEVLSLEHNTLPTPSNSEPADADATGVAVGGDHSSNLKKTKKPKEFSPEVREVASKMLAIVAKHNPVYRPPDNLEKFMAQVEEMLVKDKQDPETILRTFEWACADSEQRDSFKGWQSVVCTNKRKGKASNPAEVFRGHFATIYSQMKAQPKRKFAPSSNDERSLEKMKEWMKGAL